MITITISNLIGIGVGLTIANYGYQFFTCKNYWIAFERTMLQLVALLCVLFQVMLR
jgi:hypothetical protein